jgi:hypothetical protein
MEPLTPDVVADIWATLDRNLRSGEYTQGWGTLRRVTDNGVEHCCMGVLGEDLVKRGYCRWESIGRTSSLKSLVNLKDYADQSYPPTGIIEAIGLDRQVVVDFIPGAEGRPFALYGVLAQMNDTLHKNFVEIADFIQANLPKLAITK